MRGRAVSRKETASSNGRECGRPQIAGNMGSGGDFLCERNVNGKKCSTPERKGRGKREFFLATRGKRKSNRSWRNKLKKYADGKIFETPPKN